MSHADLPAVTAPDIATELRKLADRARHLPPPSHTNPALFHEARDELGSEIEALASRLGGSNKAKHERRRAPEHQQLPRHAFQVTGRNGKVTVVAVRRRRWQLQAG